MLLVLLACAPALHAQDADADTTRTYVVEPGDTLFRIAQRYGVTVGALWRANGLEDHGIQIGQRLRIPLRDTLRLDPPPPATARVVGRAVYLAPGSTRTETPRNPAPPDSVARDTTRRTVPEKPGAARADSVVGEALFLEAPPGSAAAETPGEAEVILQGLIAVYPDTFAGRLTASGTPYDPTRRTASHPSLPFGTRVVLVNPAGGQRVVVEINDRGPLDPAFIMDVSAAAARQLGLETNRLQEIQVRRQE